MAQALSAQKVQHLGRTVALPAGCPLRSEALHDRFLHLLRDAGDLSLDFQAHLQERPDAAAWLRSSVEASRPLLRPWAMELVFLIGSLGSARFSDLESGLGISSKVLATRLRDLQDAGHVERTVEDATPVRITYRLSKTGRATAALATPLFTHLNLAAAPA